MLRLARVEAPGARFVAASIQEAALPRCAAVTALGEVLNYYPPGHDPPLLLPLFARVREALAPGGLFLFDVVLRSKRRPMRYHASREGEGWRVEVDVVEEPERSRLTRQIRIARCVDGIERASAEIHRLQTFSRAELEGWLRKEGFTVRALRRYGEMPLAPQRMAFRARRAGR